EAATVADVFPHTAVIAEPGVLRSRRYGNVVVLGSRRPWPIAELDRELRTLVPSARILHGEELLDFIGSSRIFRDPAHKEDWYAGREATDTSESTEQRLRSLLPDSRQDPDEVIPLH